MKQEKDSLNALIIIQENRLVSKDSTIRDLRNANFAAFNAITAVRNSMANALQQRDLQREDMKYFQKLYHKQRKKTFWATVAGIAAAVGTIIILK